MPKFNEQTHIELLNSAWNPLKEPKTLPSAIILSVPFMYLNMLISIGIIYFFSDFSINNTFFTGDAITLTIHLDVIIGLIIGVFLMLIIHEFFHLIFIPNFIKSKDTYMGLTFFGGYVHTEQSLTKARFLLISIAPFAILSILAPLILGVFGQLTGSMIFFIILNSMGASVDILGFMLVLVQVPKDAVIRNNGTRTYWKVER
ncbi:DUF3267 domain-containing protein [Neobacillus sp. NPDC058068]|uniref:DUF3267 domain-containing protein n=1 Tax=Neobacillus sp. NPDC058068 TaxID=3346325 RepID=UPI0036DE16D5